MEWECMKWVKRHVVHIKSGCVKCKGKLLPRLLSDSDAATSTVYVTHEYVLINDDAMYHI